MPVKNIILTVVAFKAFIDDVHKNDFPADEHTYKMVDGEQPKLMEML
ncbi:hypothetical protein QUF90_21555 [Desulfococcaceae bacterium HSG9]|nr:hypothetical protein [Desulfococcaceae bacterium HSG9]